MKKFVVAAASAVLLASTALSIAQDTSAEEEIIKKPGANSAIEAAPSEQKPSAQTEGEASGQVQTEGQSGSATGTAQGEVKPDGSASGTAEGQAQTGETDSDAASSEQQPSTETTGSIDINTEQKTEITQVFRDSDTEPVDVDFDIDVGVAVPSTVVLHPLPPRVIEIVPAYRGYEYFVLADGRIIIVEPGTLTIVYILVV